MTTVAASSNGKTADFESANPGSTPGAAATDAVSHIRLNAIITNSAVDIHRLTDARLAECRDQNQEVVMHIDAAIINLRQAWRYRNNETDFHEALKDFCRDPEVWSLIYYCALREYF